MKKSDKQPFMSPPDYGKSLRGFTINLLTVNIERSLLFQREVIAANILHEDSDLLILTGYENNWMIHADHTYDKHPLLTDTLNSARRGAGVELRLHGRDPDEAAIFARQNGFRVLDGPRDQPDHGLREVHIIDDDGYIWVPDLPL
jgi:hypothetical protein